MKFFTGTHLALVLSIFPSFIQKAFCKCDIPEPLVPPDIKFELHQYVQYAQVVMEQGEFIYRNFYVLAQLGPIEPQYQYSLVLQVIKMYEAVAMYIKKENDVASKWELFLEESRLFSLFIKNGENIEEF